MYNVCFLCGILGPKLLDLDLINGITTEEGDSELSLKVDLQHFGEVCIYTMSLPQKEVFELLSFSLENPFIGTLVHGCLIKIRLLRTCLQGGRFTLASRVDLSWRAKDSLGLQAKFQR